MLSVSTPRAAAAPTAVKPVSVMQAIKHPHKTDEVIVKFWPGAQPQARDQVINSFAKEKKDLRGRDDVKKLKLKDGFDASNVIYNLKQMDAVVQWVEPNYLVRDSRISSKKAPARKAKPAQATLPNDPGFSAQWSLANTGQNNGVVGADIKAMDGWEKATGSRETIVAVIDTGVDLKHPDLNKNLWVNKAETNGKKNADDDQNGYIDDVNGWNFVADNADVSDDNGHGTAMTGIIGAETENRLGIAGVMWKASILPLKAIDATGSGAISDVVEAMDYAVAHGATVINCSFGTDGYSQSLYEAIHRASMAGVLVVASAGNSARDLDQTPYYPASYNLNNIISVSATTNTDQLANFSNWGKNSVHVAAPGVDILTTTVGGRYNMISGTSAAAPLVAGVAGLLKTLRGWASAQYIRQSLLLGVRKVPSLDGKVASAGVISAGDAIKMFLNNNGNPGSGDPGGGGPGGPGGGGPGTGGTGTGGQVPTGMIDFMRANRPNLPEPRVTINNVPSNPYDDPEPSSGGLAGYFYQESLYKNATGMPGSSPGQDPDPTDDNSTSGKASINLGSQNVNFYSPVVSLGGRAGLGLSLGIAYNSNNWVKNGSTIAYNTDKDVMGVGWSIGFGAIQGIPQPAANPTSIEPFWDSTSARNAYLYIAPDGARHLLAQVGSSNIYVSYDSSYIEYDKSTKVMRTMGGTQITFETPLYQAKVVGKRLLPKTIKDRNGNYLTITNAEIANSNGVTNSTHDWGIDFITDTLGRKINFDYESNLLRRVQEDRNGTPYNYVVISYAPVTISTNFNGVSTDPTNINGAQVWQPWFVEYATGHTHRLFYTSYGQMYLVEKWVPTVSGQGNGRPVAMTYYDMPSVAGATFPVGATIAPAGNIAQTDCPKFANRYEWAESWSPDSATTGWTAVAKVGGGSLYTAQYNYEFNIAGNFYKVIDPAGRYYRTDVSTDGLTHTEKVFANATAYNNGTPLKTITTTYIKDSGVSYTSNQRVSNIQITDGSYTKRVGIGYDTATISGVALPNDMTEYNADAATVYRHTVTSFVSDAAYTSRHIYGLPFQVNVYKGAGTSNLVSKVEYAYDESGEFIASSGIIQHDATNYGGHFVGRANRTLVRQYSVTGGAAGASRDVQRMTYDSQGNIRQSKHLNTAGTGYNVQVFDYSDNYSNKPGTVGATNAIVTKSRDPENYWNGAQFNYFTGNITQSFHIQQQSATVPSPATPENTVTYGYDSYDRQNAVTRPDGGGYAFAYWDNWMAMATYNKINQTANWDRYDFAAYDGAGNTRWTGGDHPDGVSGGGKYSSRKFLYDIVGRAVQASHVTETDGGLVPTGDDAAYGFLWTQVQYDALDRRTLITHPDTNSVAYTYTGCGCAGSQSIIIRDERYKYRKVTYDFLGRLYESRELTSGQATYNRARYSYDERNLLQKVEHFNSDNDAGAKQERTFGYDGYGRTTSETTPETGTATYEYWSNDLLKKKTDARGVMTTLTYNPRNLLTDIDYSDSTKDVHYDFGGYGERTLMQEKNGATVVASTSYGYDSLKRLNLETRSFQGLAGSFSVGYSYNYVDSLTQVTYSGSSFSRTVYYGYNYTGAPSNVGTNMAPGVPFNTNVMSGFNYRAFGGLKNANFGNGRRIEMGYSHHRHTMSTMKVYTVSNNDTIINNGYDYYGSTGTNNGRIQKINDYVDGAYTTTFNYDDFNRLDTATATNFSRDYDYDAWGNLLKVTASGQRESDTYTLTYANNASGAPATNRINTITYTWPGGGNSPAYAHTYDNAGNQVGDGNTGSAPNFTYDGANQLTSVGYGNSSYEYDGDGRRVKSVSGGVTTYFLWSSVLGQPVTDLTSGGGIYRAYVYSTNGRLLALQATDGSFYWAHTDHLGSGRKLTNTSGTVIYRAEMDPHGQILYEWAQSGSSQFFLNSHKFTGYERDASNLNYAKARTYYHGRGRFTQADPLGLGAADLTNPQSLNLYGYVGNDPTNFVDPSGLNEEAPDIRIVTWEPYSDYMRFLWYLLFYNRYGGGGGATGGYDSSGGSSSKEDTTQEKPKKDPEKLKECQDQANRVFREKYSQFRKSRDSFFTFGLSDMNFSAWKPTSSDVMPTVYSSLVGAGAELLKGVTKRAAASIFGVSMVYGAIGYVGHKYVSGVSGLSSWSNNLVKEREQALIECSRKYDPIDLSPPVYYPSE